MGKSIPAKRGPKRPDDHIVASVIIRKKKKTPEERAAAKAKHAANQADLNRLRRRMRILALREQGWTIRQISEELTKKEGEDGCGPTMIFNHLVAALDDLHKNYTLELKHNVQLQINKLEKIEAAHLQKLSNPKTKPDDVEKLSRSLERVWKRYDTLLGLAKPTKVEVTGNEGGPLEAKIRVILPAAAEPDESQEP